MISEFIFSSLIGLWQQPCYQKQQKTELFTTTSVNYTETYFQDQLCENSLLQFHIAGEYTTNSHYMDFVFTDVFVQVLSERLVVEMNQNQVCGISNWAVGQEVRVSGLWCDFFGYGQKFQVPVTGDKKFGIWKIENEVLFFGRLTPQLDGSTASLRPVEFSGQGFIRTP